MRRPVLVSLIAIALAAAGGCGGADSGGGSGGGSGASGSAAGGSSPSSGTPPKEIFANACGSCHTLGAAETKGSFGPNLDDLQPTQTEVAAAIKNGPGPMPPGLVKGADAAALAKYVADSAGS